MVEKKCGQDTSIWAFLRMAGGVLKGIKNIKIPAFIWGWINFMLYGFTTMAMSQIYPLLCIPLGFLAILSLAYGAWKQEKIDGGDC